METLNSILKVILGIVGLYKRGKKEIEKKNLKNEVRKRDDDATVRALRELGL